MLFGIRRCSLVEQGSSLYLWVKWNAEFSENTKSLLKYQHFTLTDFWQSCILPPQCVNYHKNDLVERRRKRLRASIESGETGEDRFVREEAFCEDDYPYRENNINDCNEQPGVGGFHRQFGWRSLNDLWFRA